MDENSAMVEPSPGPEEQFHDRMLKIYHLLHFQLGYRAPMFKRAVAQHGGVAQAKWGLARPISQSPVFLRLKREGRLDLSMEALVCLPEFAHLFTQEELDEAKRRLES